MAAPSLRSAFAFGLDVMSTALDAATNAITAVLGNTTSGSTDSKDNEWMGSGPGFVSLPAPPTSGAPSCQVVAIRQGDKNVVIAAKDYRACSQYANLQPGEACMFATVGQARVLVKKDGSITLYTTDDNTATGNPVYFTLSPKNGLLFVAPWGRFEFSPNRFLMLHGSSDGSQTNFRIQGGGLNTPGPLSGLGIGSYFTVQSGTITLSGLVNAGVGPVYSPVAYGLAEDPLTMPGTPISPVGYGAPCGLVTSASFRIGT
jgi:hypothetical protein